MAAVALAPKQATVAVSETAPPPVGGTAFVPCRLIFLAKASNGRYIPPRRIIGPPVSSFCVRSGFVTFLPVLPRNVFVRKAHEGFHRALISARFVRETLHVSNLLMNRFIVDKALNCATEHLCRDFSLRKRDAQPQFNKASCRDCLVHRLLGNRHHWHAVIEALHCTVHSAMGYKGAGTRQDL